MIDTLIVLAKRPVAGRVKTRLTPYFTEREACRLAAAALHDTLEAIAATPAAQRILAFDGDPTDWLPLGWRHVAQPTGGQVVRMTAAFAAAGSGSAALVAMDTPQLLPQHLMPFDPHRWDACLGRVRDGGYWTIGFRDARDAAGALAGVPMSTDHTAQAQLHRLAHLGLRTQLLEDLVDVDTATDAFDVAAGAPQTRFARAVTDAVAATAC